MEHITYLFDNYLEYIWGNNMSVDFREFLFTLIYRFRDIHIWINIQI